MAVPRRDRKRGGRADRRFRPHRAVFLHRREQAHGECGSDRALAKMRNQLLRRHSGAIGLVFSFSGFTNAAVILARYIAPQAILLWTGLEIEQALDDEKILVHLEYKYRNCVETGIPDASIQETGRACGARSVSSGRPEPREREENSHGRQRADRVEFRWDAPRDPPRGRAGARRHRDRGRQRIVFGLFLRQDDARGEENTRRRRHRRGFAGAGGCLGATARRRRGPRRCRRWRTVSGHRRRTRTGDLVLREDAIAQEGLREEGYRAGHRTRQGEPSPSSAEARTRPRL